jgi:hypothetical protein
VRLRSGRSHDLSRIWRRLIARGGLITRGLISRSLIGWLWSDLPRNRRLIRARRCRTIGLSGVGIGWRAHWLAEARRRRWGRNLRRNGDGLARPGQSRTRRVRRLPVGRLNIDVAGIPVADSRCLRLRLRAAYCYRKRRDGEPGAMTTLPRSRRRTGVKRIRQGAGRHEPVRRNGRRTSQWRHDGTPLH